MTPSSGATSEGIKKGPISSEPIASKRFKIRNPQLSCMSDYQWASVNKDQKLLLNI